MTTSTAVAIKLPEYLTGVNFSEDNLKHLDEITEEFNTQFKNKALFITFEAYAPDILGERHIYSVSDLIINLTQEYINEHKDFSIKEAKEIARSYEQFVINH